MDFALTDDQQAFRDLARGWVDKAVVPHAAEWDRSERMDRDIIRQLGEMGFLGRDPSRGVGGTPCDYISYVLMMEELGRVEQFGQGCGVSQPGAGNQVDRQLWNGRAAARVGAPIGRGRAPRMLRPDRAGPRVGSRQPHDQGRSRWRRLGPVGPAVHHQRELGRSGADLRPYRWSGTVGHNRFLGGHGLARVFDPFRAGETGAAGPCNMAQLFEPGAGARSSAAGRGRERFRHLQ